MPECNYFKGVILNFSSCMQFLHLHENFSIVFMYDHESERKARHQFGPVVFFANCSREQWMSEVQNHIREKGCSRADAISAVPFLYYHTGHYYCLETKLQPSCTLQILFNDYFSAHFNANKTFEKGMKCIFRYIHISK